MAPDFFSDLMNNLPRFTFTAMFDIFVVAVDVSVRHADTRPLGRESSSAWLIVSYLMRCAILELLEHSGNPGALQRVRIDRHVPIRNPPRPLFAR